MTARWNGVSLIRHASTRLWRASMVRKDRIEPPVATEIVS